MTPAISIFQILANTPSVIMSWGFDSPRIIEDGLCFNVDGFRYQGDCEVVYFKDSDTFTFRTIDTNGQILKELCGLHHDNLVDTIDRIVESGDNLQEYKKTINNWLRNNP